MKEIILEYCPNGEIKHKIDCYDNGRKYRDQYYDKNGEYHRDSCLPDYHSWYENGMLFHKTYCVHGKLHNICNPADIWFRKNGKIDIKRYKIKDIGYFKLQWQNYIKQIK
jgi:hypothetical protein